ncbi:MAG: hypothetical protein QXW39_09290, partial [Candidatus Bathyarchaeia archaeon]
MPRHEDFEKIYQQFIKRYGKEKGEQYYYAWLRMLGLDETKPYGSQVKEAFRWARLQGDEYYYCEAAFPVESMNKNIYSEEELIRAARTLIGKPVNLNHEQPLDGVEIVDAEYEDGAVECILRITNEKIRKMIDNGEIIHVSIEADFREAEVVNGIKPKGLVFTGLALLTKNVLPGIPLTRIWKSTERVLESFESHLLKEVEREMSLEEQKTCYLCGRPMSDVADLGKYQVHPQCAARFWEIATQIFHFSERAVAPHETPKAPEDREWDADAAEQRIRKWASSDGSGDKDKIDWSKYKQAFAWYDHENPENFGSYKLPHHDIIDGRLHVVWRGVVAAMQALLGARGGVDIPAADRRSVYVHLARHYAQFDREPPPLEAL